MDDGNLEDEAPEPEDFHLPAGAAKKTRQCVTQQEFYSYKLMLRATPGHRSIRLHRFRRLFRQYVVDMYTKIEGGRLAWVRTHQKELRADQYKNVRDSLNDPNRDPSKCGKQYILPSSFQGSPRHMHEMYQDAMAIIRKRGKPDLFVTFTCNPKWREISDELNPGEQANDRPDIVTRVFRLKLKALMDEILNGHVLGKVTGNVWVVEFQKRGLPHAHILLILDGESRPMTATGYDKFSCAEIPDPVTHPRLHGLIATNMVHGPCDTRCIHDGACSKR